MFNFFSIFSAGKGLCCSTHWSPALNLAWRHPQPHLSPRFKSLPATRLGKRPGNDARNTTASATAAAAAACDMEGGGRLEAFSPGTIAMVARGIKHSWSPKHVRASTETNSTGRPRNLVSESFYYTRYLPRIYQVYTTNDIPCIYNAYTWRIYKVYTWNIHGISAISRLLAIHGISMCLPCICQPFGSDLVISYRIYMVYSRYIPMLRVPDAGIHWMLELGKLPRRDRLGPAAWPGGLAHWHASQFTVHSRYRSCAWQEWNIFRIMSCFCTISYAKHTISFTILYVQYHI